VAVDELTSANIIKQKEIALEIEKLLKRERNSLGSDESSKLVTIW
jgi:hypothetical protein